MYARMVIGAELLALEAQNAGTLKADVLKVPHRGSETASTQAFIDADDPGVVVISASTLHDLPKDTVVQRYDNGVRTILRTDRDSTNDNDHVVCTQNGSVLDCSYSE